MQTHPDVASSGNHQQQTSNAEKFKRISNAYSVLSNQKDRKRYDFEISHDGIRELRRKAQAASRASHTAGSGSFGATLPRNVFIGSMIGLASVAIINMIIPTVDKDEGSNWKSKTGQKKLVQAWKNPNTGLWEPPKPWDATYQRLQPKLELVPRGQVHNSKSVHANSSNGGKR